MNTQTISKQEFKRRWDSDDDGGGISWDDIANCYVAWGLGQTPRIKPMFQVRAAVLRAAGITEECAE